MLKQVACAERDGGWFCHYCGCPLAGAATPEKLVRYWMNDGWSISINPKYRSTHWVNLDHVVPRCRGGSNELENLVLACGQCNSRKGTKLLSELPEEWWA
jgi:hypothetical protein